MQENYSLMPDEETGLVGTKEYAELLAQKDIAKILVVSDSHGERTRPLNTILEFAGSSCDAMFFCGDGISDIELLLELAEKDPELKKTVPGLIVFARGNNDYPAYPFYNKTTRSLEQRRVHLEQYVTVAGHKIGVLHSHEFSLYSGTAPLFYKAAQEQTDILLYGHTHVAMQEQDDVLILNPGSCARPRAGQKPCFATITIEKNSRNYKTEFFCLEKKRCMPYIPSITPFFI